MALWLKRTLWVIGTILLVVLILFVLLSYVLDEPLRAYMEGQLNENLKGYRVSLEDVDVKPFSLSAVLRGVTIIQEQHPDPPVANLTSVTAGVHFRPILRGRIVGKVELDQPELYINLEQLREEVSKQEKDVERGWQAAIKSIYPLEINVFSITNGRFTYIDQDPQNPLRIDEISLTANNIRNFETSDEGYPSPFAFAARVFDAGRIKAQGEADFITEPYPNGTAEIDLQDIALSHFAPVLSRYDVFMSKGRLDASGNVAYAPDAQRVHLKTLHVQDLAADYIYTETAAPDTGETAQKAKEVAQEVSDHPQIRLQIDRLQVQGDVGLVNKSTDPSYRVFLANTDLRIDNLSNQFEQGPADLALNGQFMGSGDTTVTGTFRPEDKGPDFDMNIRVEGTQLTAMNDLLRAYGNFDISAGTFSLFSELQVRKDQIDGYVKPLFKDVEVFDQRADEEKGVFKKMYEGLVEGVVDLLERQPKDRIAGRTEISGEIDEPEANTWQLVRTILQNAFFRAILPGFDQEISK